MEDDFFDAPETPSGASKWQQWGYHYFKGGLAQANVDFLEPNASEASIMRVAGRPVVENGKVVDVLPFLQPKGSRRLSEPAERLFGMTTCYQVRVARYFGPKPDFDETTNKRNGPPQLHFIDEFPPHIRRKYVSEGRQLPPTCLDILLARAPTTVARYPRFAKYFKPDDDFHNCLRKPTNVWFLNGLCLQHGKVDCDENDPLPALHLLTWTGYRSLMDLVYEEHEGYTYQEGATHDTAGTRGELARRFKCPDLTDPAGAPAVVFTSHKQKRKSAKNSSRDRGNQMEGNRYVATLTEENYPFPADVQANMWTPPQDLFWYPTPKEAFELIMANAGESDWIDFMYHLVKGTDLEIPESVPGANLESSAASQPEPAEEHTFADVSDDYDNDPSEEAMPAAPRPTGGKALGLGSFGKKREEEKETSGGPAANDVGMPVPDHTQVFTGADDGAPTAGDDPESVEARTKAVRDRLAQMRGRIKE